VPALDRLPFGVRAAVRNFQAYALAQHRAESRSWRYANQHVRVVAAAVLDCLEARDPPVDLEAAASLFGAEVGPSRGGTEGYLVPKLGGFSISVSAPEWPVLSNRSRFTVAHELGHALFYTLDTDPPRRLYPARPGLRQGEGNREEGLCDAFASSLLVPDIWISRAADRELRLRELISHAAQLEVAVHVMLKRILHDFGYWPERAFYYVWLDEDGNISVRVFRGRNCRSSISIPTGREVSEFLRDRFLDSARPTTRELLSEMRAHTAFAHADVLPLSASVILVGI